MLYFSLKHTYDRNVSKKPAVRDKGKRVVFCQAYFAKKYVFLYKQINQRKLCLDRANIQSTKYLF